MQGKQVPIYHVHIRKTAGTTVNFAFLSNANAANTEVFYESIAQDANHRRIKNNKVFVGWNSKLINEGYFSYAFSHIPLHQLNLPANTFTFTCLRDPVKRVVSHYNMLKHYQVNNIDHACMKTEGNWLGNSFEDFILNLPQKHLLNQLYMFSEQFDVLEAKERLLSLNKIIYTENIAEGLNELEAMTGWQLPVSNQKKYEHKEDIKAEQLSKLKDMLALEYELMETIK